MDIVCLSFISYTHRYSIYETKTREFNLTSSFLFWNCLSLWLAYTESLSETKQDKNKSKTKTSSTLEIFENILVEYLTFLAYWRQKQKQNKNKPNFRNIWYFSWIFDLLGVLEKLNWAKAEAISRSREIAISRFHCNCNFAISRLRNILISMKALQREIRREWNKFCKRKREVIIGSDWIWLQLKISPKQIIVDMSNRPFARV